MSLPIQSSPHHHAHHIHSGQSPTIPATIIPLKGHMVSSTDSTSSAQGTGANSAVFVSDPGVPKLPDPEHASDADLFEIVGLALAYDRRTRRRSERSKMELQLQAAMTWQQTQITVPKDDSSSSNTKGSKDSTSSTSSSSSSSTSSSSTTDTSSTSSTNTSSTQSTDSKKPTETITQMKLETGTMMKLEDTLLSSVTESLKKRFHHHIPSGLMDQIQAYIHSALTSGLLLIVPPAVGLLGDPKLGLNVDPKAVEAATAVSYQNFALKWAHSGDMQNFVNNFINSDQAQNYAKQLYPNDPAAAQNYLQDLKVTLSSTMPTLVVNSAIEMTGKALGLPGYSNQIRLQAQLVRDENTILADPSHVSSIATNVAIRNAGIDGLTEKQLQKLSTRVIHDTMFDKQGKPVDYLTHDDLLAALTTNFETALPSNTLLAGNLAKDVAANTVDIAIGKNSVGIPSFDNINFNFAVFQKDLATTISKEFAKSNETIHALTIAKEIADSLRSEIDTKQFRNEQDVRDYIFNKLLAPDPVTGATQMTPAQAREIAGAVDIGGPQLNNPLYDPKNTGILTPNDYSRALQMAYQDNLRVSPSSTFGDYINFVSGANGVAGDLSPVALLNQEWYHGDQQTRSYLNPSAEDSAKFQQLTLGDPAAAVKEWGIQHNNKIKSSNIDIPL